MLKKIIIGFLCFIFLAVIGLGIYIYMLDWNQHKKLVEERFSQITGLRAVIDGDLNVELFPTPRFTANQVKFFQGVGSREPLTQINSISANVDFMAMLHHKFILSAMTLTGTTVNYIINEQGESNWKSVGTSANNRSGNMEVSFNDVRLTASIFNYTNLQKGKHFEIPNISGFVSAPTLQGPYKLNLQFIHNESEIKIDGSIVKNNGIVLDLKAENAATSSKLSLNGTLNDSAKGNISIDTARLADFASVTFGANALPSRYNDPFYLSFQYDKNADVLKLDNFNIAYGTQTKGNGLAALKIANSSKYFDVNLDMASLDLTLIENIFTDIITSINNHQSSLSAMLSDYSADINIKAAHGLYRNAEIQNFNLALNLKDNILSLPRIIVDLPGNTSVKSSGKIDFNNIFDYAIDTNLKTDDLRTFVSLYDIDLAKLATAENKKIIFKEAESAFSISGNLQNLKLNILNAKCDNVELRGNMGFIFDKDHTFVIADINTSQILFDKYMEVIPSNMNASSLEDKIVYQLNLIPWKHDLSVDARLLIPSAVYNKVPLQKLSLEAKLENDKLQVKNLSIENIAGASLQMQLEAQNIYTSPVFKELTYDVKTNNFPAFASTLGIPTGEQKLFQRKLFASQGALSGSLKDFSLSSVQKFGDVEFSYTGTVLKSESGTLLDGDLEMKSNNFLNLVSALNLDYKPDIPVTSFALAGKIKGTTTDFSLDNMTAYMGANSIRGSLKLDRNKNIPSLSAKLDFDKFDADRYMNLNKWQFFTSVEDKKEPFIAKPGFLADKIDYSSLKKLDYNLAITAKQLVYHNKNYNSATLSATLKDGLLSVSKFYAQNDKTKLDLAFTLNSNNIPEIEGDYNVKALSLPTLGGTVYEIQEGILNSSGHFKSIIPSIKDFVENLSANGSFTVTDTAVKGWDLDLIKFELEQRKTTEGLENIVLNDLKSGLSSLSEVHGDFNVSSGLLITDNTMLTSPIADISMHFDLNLSNWLFNANFDAIYRNASFSDVLKYTFAGNLSSPAVKVDLSESMKRIGETEAMIEEAKEKHAKAQQKKLSDKIDDLRKQVNAEMKNLSQMNLYVSKYKPQTDHSDILKVYDANLQGIDETKQRLSKMDDVLSNNPVEKDLMSIESEIGSIRSKLAFIPKSLEDNFVTDSKYIFNDLFNKLIWVYTVAINNNTYYNELADIYWAQVDLLQNSEKPLSSDIFAELKSGKESIDEDIEKIKTLHNKMRENYVGIIELSNVSEIKEKNELTLQALQTLSAYTERMNNKIVENLSKFRTSLELTADDDKQYIIYPPHDVSLIDTQKPTTLMPHLDDEADANASVDVSDSEGTNIKNDDKKKEQTLSLNLPLFTNGLSSFVHKLQMVQTDIETKKLPIDLNISQTQSAPKKYADAVTSDIKADRLEEKTDSLSLPADTLKLQINNDPSDASFVKKANTTVHNILSGFSLISSSSSNVSSPSASSLSSAYPDKVALATASLVLQPVENKNLDVSDLNLKSGFKKVSKSASTDVSPNKHLAVLNILSVEQSNTTIPAENIKFQTPAHSLTHIAKADNAVYEDSNVNISKSDIHTFHGIIGKSMLSHRTIDLSPAALPTTNHLVARNNTDFLPYSGTIAKSFLFVK